MQWNHKRKHINWHMQPSFIHKYQNKLKAFFFFFFFFLFLMVGGEGGNLGDKTDERRSED